MMKRSLEDNSQKRTNSMCKHQYSPVLNNSLNNTKIEDTNSLLNQKYVSKCFCFFH